VVVIFFIEKKDIITLRLMIFYYRSDF